MIRSAVLAVVTLALIVAACGKTRTAFTQHGPASVTTTPIGVVPPKIASRAISSGRYLNEDGDSDDDDRSPPGKTVNDDIALLASYGPLAVSADRRAVTKLIKSYYAAALAENALRVCSLLDSTLTTTFSSDPKRCAAYVEPLLKQQHQRFAADNIVSMVIITVHVKGDLGLAVLGFRSMPETELVVEREGRQWKVDALLDSDLT